MRICPTCSHDNREGLFYCEDCGQNLFQVAHTAAGTRQVRNTGDYSGIRPNWGTSHFKSEDVIVLRVDESPDPIILQPKPRMILGRGDVQAAQKPDVDLNPYGALQKGVSRMHAAIYRNDTSLTLVDMGSANGTSLNGQRLSPDHPHVLRDGDEIRMGKLIAHIYFKNVEG
jgi:hypothetical protein